MTRKMVANISIVIEEWKHLTLELPVVKIIDILDYKQFISILCGMIELGLNTSIKLNIIIDILDY